jgi:hypothetical protein
MLAIGCLGLTWAIFMLPRGEAADYLQAFEARFLRSETLSPRTLRTLTLILESSASRMLDACDTHSQRAMLLAEMPLAEIALRSGAVNEFDQRIQSLETRSRHVLGCTPRESFVWLLVFYLETLHGRLNEQTFDLLAMSYNASPNEAWISIRRIIVAVPLVNVAPAALRQNVLEDFQQLIANGSANEAARSYLAASQPVRSTLQMQIRQMEALQQKAFSDALQRLNP